MKYLLIFFIFLGSSNAQSNEIKKCVDQSGKVTFTDKKECKAGQTAENVKLDGRNINDYSPSSDPIHINESITEGIRLGALRPPTEFDYGVLREKINSINFMSRMKTYVVLKPIIIGSNIQLGGSNSVIFLINDLRLFPQGNLGHSAVLITFNGTCTGSMIICSKITDNN